MSEAASENSQGAASSEISPIRVVVVGAEGRLGSVARAALEAGDGVDVVGQAGRGDDLAVVLRGSEAEVAVDATTPEAGSRHLRIYLETGVRPVIGTTGLDPAELERACAESRERGLGGLVVPNFAPGIRDLRASILAWAQSARSDAAELEAAVIVETHRRGKRDRPSGTALWLREEARRAAGTRDLPLEIESVRQDGFVARHEFVTGRPGERTSVVHEITDARAFGPGIVAAVRRVVTLQEWRVDLP